MGVDAFADPQRQSVWLWFERRPVKLQNHVPIASLTEDRFCPPIFRVAEPQRILPANLLASTVADEVAKDQVLTRFVHADNRMDHHPLAWRTSPHGLVGGVGNRRLDDAQRAVTAELLFL